MIFRTFRKLISVTAGVGVVAVACLSTERENAAPDARPTAAKPVVKAGKDTVARCGDGDTCTLTTGEILRFLEIDAPELGGARCKNERTMANRARDRMSALTVNKQVQVNRSGKIVRYGRTLGRITVAGRDTGAVLMSEGLAVRWRRA